MSWLKSARSLKGITTRQLAAMVGKSQIYIQKIEGGEKPLPAELEESIYGALGFSPSSVPFDTPSLLLELDSIEGDEVLLGFVLVDCRVYFNSVMPSAASKVALAENALPTSKKLARLLLESQLSVWG